MSKKDNDEELERTHIWLYKDDIEWIKRIYGPSLGYSEAIRMMVRKFRKHIEAKAAASAQPIQADSNLLDS